jgi:predicted nucleic acid-binding protein
VLRLALEGQANPIFGNALIAKYEVLLALTKTWKKCPLSEDERAALFDPLLNVNDWVRIKYPWRPNHPDEADKHVLELAVAAGAKVIVTAHVRDFGRAELLFPSVRILTPSKFLKWRQER